MSAPTTERAPLSRNGRSAVKYATDFGWFVFPCHWPTTTGVNGEARCSCGKLGCGKTVGKHPRTRNGLKDATTDVMAIARWYRRDPDANIAIACGSGSGIVVIDVDDGDGKYGSESLSSMEEQLGPLPSTVEALTGGGGRHLLFRCPRGVRVSSRVGIVPGIDVRGDGGYIIAPPSLHRTGRSYEWEASSRPGDVEIADLPQRWLAALQDQTPSASDRPAVEAPDFENLPKGLDRRARSYVSHMDAAVSGANGHKQTFKVACAIVRGMCVNADTALDILREYNRRCSPPWEEKDLRHKVAEAVAHSTLPWGYLLGKAPAATPTAPAEEPAPESGPASKPVIVITADEPGVVNQSIASLVRFGAPMYQRGGMLVRVLRGDTSPKAMSHVADTPTIAALPQPRLRELMAGAADWVQERTTRDGEIIATPAHPPEWAVKQVEARGEWQGIKSLHAIVETPVLRADGSVLCVPGYDDATGLIYEPNLPPVAIPDKPDQGDAMRAALALLEIVVDFPFASVAHQSAWLAGCLTPFARYAFAGPAPCTMIDATTRGSGKTLLADSVSYLVTGREMPRMPQAEDGEEERKRITAIALSAFRCVLLDNVTKLGSTALDAALTGNTWTERILGESRQVVLPLTSCWYATGNNVRLLGDIVRRTLHVRLESSDENPEQRSNFRHPDLVDWVRQERTRLVTAALTMLRAYCVAGRPYELQAWGSFEGWSRMVRGAVVFAGLDDPGETRKALAETSDTDAANVYELLCGWTEMAGDVGTSRGAMTPGTAAATLASATHKYQRLRDALAEFCRVSKGGSPSAADIGYVLRRFRGRVVDGRKLAMASIVRGQKTWIVEEAPKT